MSILTGHGRYSLYANGRCDCDLCTNAFNLKMTSLRRSRYAERVMKNGRWYAPRAKHGTPSGYGYWGCRCVLCGEANRVNATIT